MLDDAVAAFLDSVTERGLDEPLLALLRSLGYTHVQRIDQLLAENTRLREEAERQRRTIARLTHERDAANAALAEAAAWFGARTDAGRVVYRATYFRA